MSEWIDKLHADHQLKEADDAMHLAERQVAQEAALTWMPAIGKSVQDDVAYFRQRFPRAGKIEGPITLGNDGTLYVATSGYPLCKVSYNAEKALLVSYSKEYRATPAASTKRDNGVLNLKARIGGDSWYEHKGEILKRPEDVSQFLLEQVFKTALALD